MTMNVDCNKAGRKVMCRRHHSKKNVCNYFDKHILYLSHFHIYTKRIFVFKTKNSDIRAFRVARIMTILFSIVHVFPIQLKSFFEKLFHFNRYFSLNFFSSRETTFFAAFTDNLQESAL